MSVDSGCRPISSHEKHLKLFALLATFRSMCRKSVVCLEARNKPVKCARLSPRHACTTRGATLFSGMANYVALIRGIGPMNPNMRNEKLAGVLKSLGCTDVRPVLASGNLVFTSTARSTAALETKIEKAFSEKLGLSNDVIVQSQVELEAITKKNPFKGAEHGKQWYLVVTFRKGGEPPVFNKIDRATMDGPDVMKDLEKRYGKKITTRTWNTVLKIIAKMQSAK
jgi:uncharacterized protein (DUF1697 family)